ncbi:MAG: GNAT family N-acetyltransferase [Caldilineaceae bacterium]
MAQHSTSDAPCAKQNLYSLLAGVWVGWLDLRKVIVWPDAGAAVMAPLRLGLHLHNQLQMRHLNVARTRRVYGRKYLYDVQSVESASLLRPATRLCRAHVAAGRAGLWKAMPFDDDYTAEQAAYMDEFFRRTYAAQEETFFDRTLVVCDPNDQIVGTCFLWQAYGLFNTLHWFKVIKAYEGRGIGRALLSILFQDVTDADLPIYLHTQPESYRGSSCIQISALRY